jgi:hypothetical protein
MNDRHDPRVTRLGRGRALYVGRQGELFIANRYTIRRSDDGGQTWRLDCYVPPSGWKPYVAWARLSARLLRYYIAAFEILSDGTRVAVARDGVYRAAPGEMAMTRSFRFTRGSRPLNLAVDGNRVLFGEYGNLDDCAVCIYVSEDGGKSFEPGYRLPRGDVRHIHNVIFDPCRNHYWVLAGDFGRQPGIAALSKDLKSLDWLCRGEQKYRAVGAILHPDRLVYGTDSDHERNFIVALDLQSGRVEELLEVEGSSLYATRFGSLQTISTCVEPNPACPSRECSLYVSRGGAQWKRTFVQQKDCFHDDLFHCGAIVLPYGYGAENRVLCSGQALQGADDVAFLLNWPSDTSP